MIDVSRLAARVAVPRLESPRARLMVAPGHTTSGTTPPIVVAQRYVAGISARLDLSKILKLRLVQIDPGPVPSPIAAQVRRARALRDQARLAAEEATLTAMDTEAKEFAKKLQDAG